MCRHMQREGCRFRGLGNSKAASACRGCLKRCGGGAGCLRGKALW